jgi:hypothetical protein
MHSTKRRTFGATAFLALAVGIAYSVGGVPTQEAKLTAMDAAANDFFGASVAVAGDTAVVGALGKNSYQGAAYVFTRTGTTWTQEAELTAADPAANDYFGYSVALAGDTAVVGAALKNARQGAAYVFTRTGTTWMQEAKLVAADPAANDYFGYSVAVAGDTAVVGAFGKDSQGAAYVFTRTGTTWTQEAKLTAEDAAANDFFGYSVALEGDTAVAGANDKSSAQGAAYVFTRTGTTWTQEAKLTAADAASGDQFGNSVALAGDTVVAGANDNNSARGAAYVFTRTGTTWTQEAKLTAADAANGDQLGNSVALAGDTAVAGAYVKNSGRGAAYVFTRTGTTWTRGAKLAAADAANGDQFGDSVAFVGDTAVAGAYYKDSYKGAAFVFTGVGPPPGYCLPTKVKAKTNAAHPEKSTLIASGTLDTGNGVPDFSGAATFDVGGFHFIIPALVAKGSSLWYSAGGITLTIKPAKNGSSHAIFTVKVVGDLTGKIDPNASLSFNFTNAVRNLNGTANLTAGALGLHGVTGPDISFLNAAATLKGGGKDALKLRMGFATDGTVPVAAEDLTFSFGDTYTAEIPAASFVRRGSTFTFAGKAPGITKATVDFVKGTITIAGAGIDLGAFSAGGNAVRVTITRGSDMRSVTVRMAGIGGKLAY